MAGLLDMIESGRQKASNRLTDAIDKGVYAGADALSQSLGYEPVTMEQIQPGYNKSVSERNAYMKQKQYNDMLSIMKNALVGRDQSELGRKTREEERLAMQQMAGNVIERGNPGLENVDLQSGLRMMAKLLLNEADRAIDEYNLPIWGRNYKDSDGLYESTRREIERQRKERDSGRIVRNPRRLFNGSPYSQYRGPNEFEQYQIPGEEGYIPRAMYEFAPPR